MKKREINELKSKTAEELNKLLAELREKKIKTEVSLSSGKETDLKVVAKIRRDIAQVMTIKGIIERSGEKVGIN